MEHLVGGLGLDGLLARPAELVLDPVPLEVRGVLQLGLLLLLDLEGVLEVLGDRVEVLARALPLR